MSWINPNHDAIANKAKQEALDAPAPFEITAEIKQKVALESVLNARANMYPSIGDQLDALFKAGAFPADMAAQIQAVKDANPKPTA